MTEKLVEVLERYALPVILHGNMAADEEYPASFITFKCLGSPEQDFFDGIPFGTQWRFSVAFYTNTPELLSTMPKRIYADLKAEGFIPQGKGYDIPSDEPGWNGWVNEYYFLEV